MKTIGIIGGMSWESTDQYYRIINEEVNFKLGGLHSAKILMYSVDFDEIEKCQSANDWEKAAEILGDAAKKLENAGADFIVICSNTMHKVVPQIKTQISIPILHIADTTARKLAENGIRKVGLLGTKYTMTDDFYKQYLISKGFEVIVPGKRDISTVNEIIYKELCNGVIKDESREEMVEIIQKMEEDGAEAVVLACTELSLLIGVRDSNLPLFDTTVIHALAAAKKIFERSK